MTQLEKLKILDDVVSSHKSLEDMCNKLEAFTGIAHDALIFNTMREVAELSQDYAKQLVGDDNNWLDWYIYENDCGSKELKASIGLRMRKIKTTKDLLWLIEN